MIIEFNLSNLIFIAFGAIAGLWALMKIIALQSQRFLKIQFEAQQRLDTVNRGNLDKRLDSMESTSRTESSQWQRVERDLLTLKADMPLNYVRREDYIRGQSVIEAKLDGLGSKLENAQLRSARNV